MIGLLSIAIFGFAPTASTQEIARSHLSVPIATELSDLQRYADGVLPRRLHHKEYNRTCVEAERACTKVPEFRSFEVAMKNRCVNITPRIDCSISENVSREGPIRISGDGGTIVLKQAIDGSATVRGRGEIGRHIRQTVRAKADVTVKAKPSVRAD
ncbi:MAG: DUF4403 family protein [Pseudomonadota bacterium]